MAKHIRLPFAFDPAGLRQDLATVQAHEWVAHYKAKDYDGDWSGVALRGINGQSSALYSLPNALMLFADTPVLERCANFRVALASFDCPIGSARLLKLAAGSRILEHQDDNLSIPDGEVRLHIPVQTSPEVEFYLDGERVRMNEGEVWYLNFNLPHRVENPSSLDRVHLVIDCVVNDWLRDQLSC
jgi:hypothetical protein